jgi:hypothetical protein
VRAAGAYRRTDMAPKAHRALAESALKQMCERIGVAYATESEYVEGAWFLDTESRGRATISQWCEGSRVGGRSVHRPLGNYGENLTYDELYDRLWFADRILTARSEAMTHNKAG